MFPIGRNKSAKSLWQKRKKTMERTEGEKSGRSFLCKVRIERRICSSPSAVSVPPCTFSRPAEVSLAFFIRRHWLLPIVFWTRRSSSRCSSQRYWSSRSEFSKPERKVEDRALPAKRETGEEDEGEEEAAKDRERKWGREPMRGSIRLYSKGGIRRRRRRHHCRRRRRRVCGIRWWSYSVLPPSGSDVTSRCNKHEYKWFLRPVPTVTRPDLIESRRSRKLEVNGNKASSALPNK